MSLLFVGGFSGVGRITLARGAAGLHVSDDCVGHVHGGLCWLKRADKTGNDVKLLDELDWHVAGTANATQFGDDGTNLSLNGLEHSCCCLDGVSLFAEGLDVVLLLI